MCGGGTESTAFFPTPQKTGPIFDFSEKVRSPTSLESVKAMAARSALTLDTTGVDTSTKAGLRSLLRQLALQSYAQVDSGPAGDSLTVRRCVERLMALGSRCDLEDNLKKLRKAKPHTPVLLIEGHDETVKVGQKTLSVFLLSIS